MSDRARLGKKGENLAVDFLLEKGYQLILSNYRSGRNEIDLILKRDDLMVFVEVKTKSNTEFGEPEEAVSDEQIERIINCAEDYMEQVNWKGNIRFDIIAITIKVGYPDIIHFEDAF